MNRDAEFERIVGAVLARFFVQNGRVAPPAAQLAQFAAQLRALVAERGLPPPLAPGELGAPGGMSEEQCAPLVTRVLSGLDPAATDAASRALLADAARQLVKACFYPEFKVCRDSFREVASDGSCRRQQLGRVRGRISGSHCVDCPHWVAHAPEQHADFLARNWHGAAGCADARAAEFFSHRTIFLPEDFRALRRWLHAAARRE